MQPEVEQSDFAFRYSTESPRQGKRGPVFRMNEARDLFVRECYAHVIQR
jgi:hypothetical protein